MENLSANVCPRVRCGKTTGKQKVGVTQLNPKQHCRDFVRMTKRSELALISQLFLKISDLFINVKENTFYVKCSLWVKKAFFWGGS